MKKVLILYSELAGYTINCLNAVIEKYNDVEIHTVRWPINKEAPFQFDFSKIKVYERDQLDDSKLLELAKQINPDLIICSGWMDKAYLKICQHFKGRINTVLTLDNPWRGGVKQRIAGVLSPLMLKNKFSHLWVPGESQEYFGLKLGFDKKVIRKGFYSANVSLFSEYYASTKNEKSINFPKRFLYVGRYVKHKGIFEMWNAFIKLQQEEPNDWELWCIGTGEEYKNRVQHEKIKHFGFVQPSEFSEYIKKTGVYILPSHIEPWGVSLQEFCAAGFPLLCSDKVGASEIFMKDKENGFVFQAGNEDMLKDSLRRMIHLSENELITMQKKSVELSLLITPDKWAETLYEFIHD